MEMMWLISFLIASPAYAAVTQRGILPRQTTSPRSTTPTQPPSTLGYYSNGEDTAKDPVTTIWAPITAPTTTPFYFTSSGDFFRWCSLFPSYSTSAGDKTTSISTSYLISAGSSACPIWTSCGGGYLYGAGGASTFCQSGDYRCMTYNVLPSYGASGGQTSLTCSFSSPGKLLETKLYKALPASTGLTAATPTQRFSESGSASPASTPSNGGPINTGRPEPASSSTRNTAVIAGSVVGGIAVIAFAGVAVLFILRRNKRNKANDANDAATIGTNGDPHNPYDPNNPYAHQQVPAAYYPPYQDNKPQELQGQTPQPVYEAPGNNEFVGVSPHGSPGLPNASPRSGYTNLSSDQTAYGGNEHRPQSLSPHSVQSAIPTHAHPSEMPIGPR
ncbi:hypothetical protein CC80DRAFT_88503 [Byssothecium circinans]|uniref:Mid2 domain-containing protein n=1 Tax=Byssothecium circinans TaxID=147558 RepID=A0A6A5U1V4_9PLEO|nr:hypothetical protein CC80DRAFT_88503 [Byssothecium circinans]